MLWRRGTLPTASPLARPTHPSAPRPIGRCLDYRTLAHAGHLSPDHRGPENGVRVDFRTTDLFTIAD